MNKTVNFEIAKLLKEKGFEGAKSPLWYYKDGTLHETPTVVYEGLKCWNTWDATQGVRWDAPTIAEVVSWMYKTYGIWIYSCQSTARLGFRCFIQRLNILGQDDISFDDRFDEPTKAYEAAIKYTLENLIQGGNNEQQ